MERRPPKSGSKSIERLAFEVFLRTGRRVLGATESERKFNPYHDPRNGQFTFAPGGPKSIADPIFSDRHGQWQERRKENTASKTTVNGNSSQKVGGSSQSTAREEPGPDLQLAGGGGRAGRSGRNTRRGRSLDPRGASGDAHDRLPFDDLATFEQIMPYERSVPELAMLPVPSIDELLHLTTEARALSAELYDARVRNMVNQITAIDRNYHYSSLGPVSTHEGRVNEINKLRFDRAVALYRMRRDSRALQLEVLRVMQRRANSAYDEAVAAFNAGRLRPRLSREEAIGNFIDGAVRRELRQLFEFNRIDYSAGQPVRVVGREYDSSGTDRTFRIPDARVGGIAFDVTLTQKTPATPQVRGFFSGDFRPYAVIIIRPAQLGADATYLITRPRQ